MKRFYIDHDDIHSLGLTGSVLLCYTALRALCANPSNSWHGSYQRLSDESGCGSRMTAERSVAALVQRGLITQDGNQYSIAQFVQISAQIDHPNAQNEQSSAHIVQSIAQNVQISKEKSNKKENIIKEIKESESYNTSPAPAMIKKENNFIPPTWNEWWAFAKEKQMGVFEAQKSFSYYEMRGWKDVCKWKAALVYWDMKNKT